MATNAFHGTGLVCVRGGRTVFEGLDFRLAPGGALVLVGPNGSGKSSLLRLMAGLGRPAAGTIAWGGEDVREDPAAHRARLHYVGHADAVKPVMTVAEDVRFWAALDGREADVGAALDALGIAHLADVPGQYLSAGQRRRLALARLVAAPAELWLLDEPKTALDADAQRRLDAAVASHRAGGGRVAVASHGGDAPADAEVLDVGRHAVRGTAA